MALSDTIIRNLRGLLATHNDTAAAGDNYDVESAVNGCFEHTVTVSKAADGSAAATTSDAYFFLPERACVLVAADVLPQGALTSNDTNFATITVEDSGGTLASETTETSGSGGSGNWTAGTEVPLTISDSAIAAGDTVKFENAKSGSGVVVPASVIQLTVRYES